MFCNFPAQESEGWRAGLQPHMCTHPVVAICLGLFLFLAAPTGLSISVFPSESLHNFPPMMPLGEKREAGLGKQIIVSCVAVWSPGFFSHLLKWGGSTEEDREASSGELSEWQINWQHLQEQVHHIRIQCNRNQTEFSFSALVYFHALQIMHIKTCIIIKLYHYNRHPSALSSV